MNMLPNFKQAVIPAEKLIKYSLNIEKDYNKATTFRLALGYTINNAHKLIENIHHNLENHVAAHKGNNGFGEVYECILKIKGENGKQANVLTSWIIETGTNYPRLTNVYVTKKKAREPK
ncbi:MAG: hypothetical protein FWD03_04270 [Defluviitaleaceae bacterium]|nr:hypothetical protein [Defluviitaleaceae bacterium]